jgi:hypothetical protein
MTFIETTPAPWLHVRRYRQFLTAKDAKSAKERNRKAPPLMDADKTLLLGDG